MNERINKLAKQAVFESYKAGCIDQKEIVLEKFAELIVRECALYVDTLLGDADNEVYPDGQMLLEHFGVDNETH
jgi:hypothetical protein